MKRINTVILAFLLCVCVFLGGCKKEDPQIVEAQAVIEATEDIRKDPTATTVTVIDASQMGQETEENVNVEAGAEEKEAGDTNSGNR